ncbi:fumarate/nitrate reduction transcriptional regulator Fnr [Methylophaga sp.]|jgi:CRP/FNR family transcriptional regulator|uniref:fumarate/nitrate reduction transcriptional regulator Fnr n=1 Tax=Methylophaga sp. TaxID=2024840 RepID=UPI0013FEF16B|nr:fumarate/nitrate reduction transcriptional regulator Fnr [Methylophaga sp.]MTI63008.1 fumarate/nitrate reduction transcriptional regulator Fnr [Methylophaga sp.]
MAQLNNVTPLFKDLAKVEHEHNIACRECSLYRLCLPLGLHSNDLAQLDKIIKRSQGFTRGEALFASDTPFKSIFVVRSGSFKTTVQASDGREQVTGFYFPGEFIGMDAIYEQAYKSTAKALESSSVCELPFEKLQEFGTTMPQLQVQMMSRLSKELSGDKTLMFLLGKKTAEEKLATFLLSLSRRFQDRGFSAREFQLTMSRGDIANHLGLAVETVSRLFTRFQDEGLISIQSKAISLLDSDKLKQLCG